jgi:hypothetical protein
MVAAAQFDHAYALPFSLGVLGETIKFGDIVRGKMSAHRLFHSRRRHVPQGDGPIVQSEHGFHASRKFRRNMNRAVDTAVPSALVIVLMHFHAKHFAEFAGFAPQPNAMPRRGCLYNFKSVCPRETFDLRQIICVGAMLCLELFAGKMTAIARKQIRKLRVRV